MATNGDRFAIACWPSRHNRLPLNVVKVLCCGTMTADALSSMAGLKLLKRVKGGRVATASLKEVGFTPERYNEPAMDATSDVRADERFRLALFGNPVAHSVSPAMHNAALRALGLDGCYVARCVRHEELPAAVDELRRPPYLGANVTVPHKEAAARLVETLDGEAAAIGAANTIVRDGDRLRGYNTDARGLLSALEAALGVVPYGLRILLLGAGGAARAAAVALLSGGPASLTIYNRHAARAEALAVAMRERYGGRVRAVGPEAAREEAAEADLIVNATSAGLDGVCVPLDGIQTRPGSSLYDMVYTPSPTPLMRLLAAQGANVANGLDMLVFQAAASFTLWTGRAAPVQVMREAALAELQRRGALTSREPHAAGRASGEQ